MRWEVDEEQDIDLLAASWTTEEDTHAGLIQRIEDLPRLEEVGGADIEWVVDGIIAQGALHMLTSEPGAGKSTFMSSLAFAVSLGREFMGRITSKRPVLLLDAENPYPAIRERFGRLGIETHENLRVWGQWVGEDPPSVGGAIVMEWVERCEPKPLIIVDSVIAFHPGAENDSNETRRYMAQYRKLTAMGATPALLHHIGKSDTSRDYRGSSDYKASIDIGYKLTNLGDAARLVSLELRPFKQRFSVAPVLHLRYSDGIFSVDQAETRKSVTERLCDLMKENPRISKADFEALAHGRGLGRNRGRKFLDDGIAAGTISVEDGPKNSKLHIWSGKPVSLPPETGTND
jgi:hypothetical protein